MPEKHVGDLIRERRKELGVTQRALAEKVGKTFPHISKVESGTERASDELLIEIAQVLDMDRDGLLLAADRLPEDLAQTVLDKSDLAPAFLRSWQSGEITDEQVGRMVKRAQGKP